MLKWKNEIVSKAKQIEGEFFVIAKGDSKKHCGKTIFQMYWLVTFNLCVDIWIKDRRKCVRFQYTYTKTQSAKDKVILYIEIKLKLVAVQKTYATNIKASKKQIQEMYCERKG